MSLLHVSQLDMLRASSGDGSIKVFDFVREHSVQAEPGIHCDEGEPLSQWEVGGSWWSQAHMYSMPQLSEHCPAEPEQGELGEEGAVCSALASGLNSTAHHDILPQGARPFIDAQTLHPPGLTANHPNAVMLQSQ